MAEDGVIRIGAEFDVSKLVAGAAQASEATKNLGTSISDLASRMLAQGLTEEQTISALVNLNIGAKEAAAAVQAAGQASTATTTDFSDMQGQVAALRAEVTALQAQIIALQGQLDTMHNRPSPFQGMAGAMSAARTEAGVLTGSVGMMTGGLARAVAQSEILGPLMQAAFVPFAILAFVEILDRVVTGFDAASDAVAGYTKALQEAEKQAVKSSDESLSHAATLAGAQEKLRAITEEQGRVAQESFGEKFKNAFESSTKTTIQQEGALASLRDALIMTAKDPLAPFEALSGSISGLWHAEGQAADYAAKLAEAQRKASEEAARFTVETSRQQLTIVEAQEAAARAGLSGTTAIREEITALKEKQSLEAAIAAQEVAARGGTPTDQSSARARVDEEYAAKRQELNRRLTVEELSEERTRLENQKTVLDAQVALSEDVTKREFELHHISIEQERTDLETLETERFTKEQEMFTRREALLREQQSRTGQDVGPELERLNAEREAAEVEHTRKIYDIDSSSTAEQIRLEQERAIHAIEIDRQIAESTDSLEAHRAEIELRNADTVSEIQTTSAEYVRRQTAAIEDQVRALQQENAVLSQGPKTQQGVLADPAEAQKFADNVAKINQLRSEETRVAIDQADQTERRTNEIYTKEASDQATAITEATRVTVDGLRRQEDQVRQSYESRFIGSRQYLETVRQLASQEFVAEADAVAAQMQLWKTLADAKIIRAEEVAKKYAELDKQITDATLRMADDVGKATDAVTKRQEESITRLSQSWARDWGQMVNTALTSNTRISVIVTQGMRQIELQMIDKGITMIVENWTKQLLKLVTAHVAAETATTAATVAGNSAKVASDEATHAKSIITTAKDAAAKAYDAMVGIPIVGPALAVAAAAGAFAVVMAFAEKGAVVPQDMPMFVHKNEMVLPEKISTFIQGAASAALPVPAGASFDRSGGSFQSLTNIVNSNSSSASARTTSTHGDTHIHLGQTSVTSSSDIRRAVQQGLRRGQLNR